jgi:hypothetical protein
MDSSGRLFFLLTTVAVQGGMRMLFFLRRQMCNIFLHSYRQLFFFQTSSYSCDVVTVSVDNMSYHSVRPFREGGGEGL